MRYCAPIAFLVAAVLWHVLVFRLAPRIGLVKLNFSKTPIMASYGIVSLAYSAAAIAALGQLGLVEWHYASLYLWIMAAMWALGAIDDIFGSREVGGFSGHFRKLVLEHRLTTGALKAIGGGVVGTAVGWAISEGDPVKWILAALVTPLSANVLNLVDLRPGRAVAVFLGGLGVICVLALGRLQAPWVVAAIVVVTLAWAFVDARGKAMMGDAGSNSLGAALGVTIALNTAPAVQVAAVVLFAVVHWYTEKHSISALIERCPMLRAIDSRLGVR